MIDINVLDTPREVDEYEDNDGFVEGYGYIWRKEWNCPTCSKRLIRYENICPKCGQLLKWQVNNMTKRKIPKVNMYDAELMFKKLVEEEDADGTNRSDYEPDK